MATREETQKQVAEWIDTDAIAEAILDVLEDEGIEVTADNAQKVWLDFLGTELNEGLDGSVHALAEKGEILYI
jgi:hypothetical protein